MIRVETLNGWWLTTHPDHAHLAAAFAEQWGNDLFQSTKARRHVLKGIASHDDGWAARDAEPHVTREGKPSAFSVELVGKYSAFEEIDVADYIAVRRRAVQLVADTNSYAALLISMHTYNLLTARADRSTVAPPLLPLLDAFLEEQLDLQRKLFIAMQQDDSLTPEEKSWSQVEDHFRLLQAVDNLSLLGCVDYAQPATLLHPLRLRTGDAAQIDVQPLGQRCFRLTPYPFHLSPLKLEFPSRHVTGSKFEDVAELRQKYGAAEPVMIAVTVSA